MKTIDTLIDDVVDLLEVGVDLQTHKNPINRFTRNMKDLVKEFLNKKENVKEPFDYVCQL